MKRRMGDLTERAMQRADINQMISNDFDGPVTEILLNNFNVAENYCLSLSFSRQYAEKITQKNCIK